MLVPKIRKLHMDLRGISGFLVPRTDFCSYAA